MVDIEPVPFPCLDVEASFPNPDQGFVHAQAASSAHLGRI